MDREEPVSELFLDIETQRTSDPAVIKRLQDAVKPPGQYKKADSIAQWMLTEGQQARVDAVNKTSLDGTYGRLATIGYAEGDEEPTILLAKDEVVALQLFSSNLDRRISQGIDIVAFNGEFDLRFLMKRYVINRLQVPNQIHLALRREGYVDPMKLWEGYRGYISQAELERVLGIARADDLDGSMVGDAIDVGDWDAVINHNLEDIRCLREIYRRLTE